jgi:hypothetical protein
MKRNYFLKYLCIVFFLFITFSARAGDTTKVLFVGNSYTQGNNLTNLFKQLSTSGGKLVFADKSAFGGYRLEYHTTNATTLAKINQAGWDYVILQEFSTLPTIEHLRYNNMYPAARILDSIINIHETNTAFFMTWSRKYGGRYCIGSYCSPLFVNFYHMQDSLNSAYTEISNELEALLCPVGLAWGLSYSLDSNINLWQSDNSHPTLEGSYLSACVFYAKIFNESPVGISYTAGLDTSVALFLQTVADETVTSLSGNSNNIYPESIHLYQNYPNPFNPFTTIRYNLPKNSYVSLGVYDALGKEVNELISGFQNAGSYEVEFEAKDLPSGNYFYKLTIGDKSISRKMILMK